MQFPEIDRAGVLYFGNYYRFKEEGEHAFWRSMGVSVVTEVDGREIDWPRVRTSCEYYSPTLFEDEIELALRVMKVGSRSVGFQVEFTCKARRIALGRMTVVFVRSAPARFGPSRFPNRFDVSSRVV